MTDTPLPPASKPFRPTARFLLAHPAHFIALGFGSGLSPVAPGTALGRPVRHVLSNSFAFGGSNAALLFAAE